MSAKPSALFVCVKNGGKSQMAAGILRDAAGDRIVVHSAGTEPGTELNTLSVESLQEINIDIRNEKPKPIDPVLLREVSVVILLGNEAKLENEDGITVQRWDTDEPSERGIDGIERMRLIRDDIATRVDHFANELLARPRPTTHE